MSVCDECKQTFINARALEDHYCPIYYTRPGMTHDATYRLFLEFIERIRLAGYCVIGYHFPPDRCTMLVEVGFDNLDQFGAPERHDRREERAAQGDRN